jgi:hypothetical protein
MIEIPFREVRAAHRRAPDAALVVDLECALDVVLPTSFVEFLLVHGGTSPDLEDGYVASPIAEPCSWGALHVGVFFGAYDDGSYDIRKVLQTYAGRIPVGMVPFNVDPGGNLALLSTQGADAGAVYFRDHEHRELAERAKRTIGEVYAKLEAAGVATMRLDVDDAIMRWEALAQPYPGKAPGYGNLYLIADSFEEFLDGLRIVE